MPRSAHKHQPRCIWNTQRKLHQQHCNGRPDHPAEKHPRNIKKRRRKVGKKAAVPLLIFHETWADSRRNFAPLPTPDPSPARRRSPRRGRRPPAGRSPSAEIRHTAAAHSADPAVRPAHPDKNRRTARPAASANRSGNKTAPPVRSAHGKRGGAL